MINVTINDSNGSQSVSINTNVNITANFGTTINASAIINLINSISAMFNTAINISISLDAISGWQGDIELREDGSIAFRENNTTGIRE